MKRAAFVLLALFLLVPSVANAFCGFYVSGAGGQLFNDATQVVMMREGTRTVLSMQNAYKGPPEKFAMVVPVPVVLQKENVKTLPMNVFEHVDTLAAPRLVEYWEQDPCAPEVVDMALPAAPMAAAPRAAAAEKSASDLGVKIEAQFTVGEYEIVILSAKDSSGLDTWLRQEKYTIPEGAEPYLRPYVTAGSKFFVARVDIEKVKFDKGLALLSPLRFHYDSDEFRLPIRLGLINSSGAQDLIIHILARGKRYEAANYPNAKIPTNLDVSEAAKNEFGTFYTTLFDRTLAKNPKAVITEYAWEPTSCDPCPGPGPLDWSEMTTFGLDVLPSTQQENAPVPPTVAQPPQKPGAAPAPAPVARPRPPVFNPRAGQQFVLTRLHARYTKESLGEDLVFRESGPIVGGREVYTGKNLETGAAGSSFNNFQARYAVRHPWTGPITCKTPVRGKWGGPPGAQHSPPVPKAAQKLGLVERKAKTDLGTFLKSNAPEIDFALHGDGPAEAAAAAGKDEKKSCGACAVGSDATRGGALVALFGIALLFARRRR
jgi:MYXO-CTERM domain-containing protein